MDNAMPTLTIWGEFDARDFEAECPYCGNEVTPSEMCLEDLPDYLSLFHRCKSCGSEFETIYGLNRVE